MANINANQVETGSVFRFTRDTKVRTQAMVDIGSTKHGVIKEGVLVEACEKPKSYGDSGRCIKFRIWGEKKFEKLWMYEWWSDFKANTEYITKEDLESGRVSQLVKESEAKKEELESDEPKKESYFPKIS